MDDDIIDNIEEKLKNIEEWNKERERIKPVVDSALDFHNKARIESRWRNYKQADEYYKEAIKKYKEALGLNPKWYLQDLTDRIDHVLEEYMYNLFNLKISGDNLKTQNGIREFETFINNLKPEETRYINRSDIARAFFDIANFYFESQNFKEAYNFYKKVIDINCEIPYINCEAYMRCGKLLLNEARFKEALIEFVSALSFDRGNLETIGYIEECLKRLGIIEHRERFISATPNEARKLIMEVL